MVTRRGYFGHIPANSVTYIAYGQNLQNEGESVDRRCNEVLS
jgi:hypothetical protein